MNRCRIAFTVFLLMGLITANVYGSTAVWQWSVSVRNARESNGTSRAFLWIPPKCRFVKGVVVAQNNMEEQSIVESGIFRKAMADLSFAIIWVSPSFDHLLRFDLGSGETLEGLIDDLADKSGYSELGTAPLVPMGHSASASWPYYLAAWKPDRVLAAISVSGQWPYFRSEVFAPDIWGRRNIDYVPCLESMGEYEAADTWSAEGLKERQAHPLMPLSMLSNPAQGHFAASDEKIRYLILYLRKAVQYRFAGLVDGKAAVLRPIDPQKTGWLADRWHFDKPPAASPAPVATYLGDRKEAFWYFDEELAKATVKYQSAYQHLKSQLLDFIQQGTMIRQTDTHQQVNLKFLPVTDGITFHLRAGFLDTVPGDSPRLTAWANLPVGSKIGHANTVVQIDKITGPFMKINDSTFRIAFERGMNPTSKTLDLWFIATATGDAVYKPAVQQAKMTIPAKIISGKDQHINFPGAERYRKTIRFIPLQAVSDANLPVQYYVRDGPAEIVDHKLRLTGIPPRSKFPVSITVVASQYGKPGQGGVNTAVPVEKTILITY